MFIMGDRMMWKQSVSLRRAFGFSVLAGLMTGWCVLMPGTVSGQTPADGSPQQAVMKIEESTHPLTRENQATKQIIISKVYDTQEPLGNSYLLRASDSNKAVVIDPGYNYEAVVKYLGQQNVDVEAILLTNGGFLRIAGNEELQKKWPNATILVGEKDAGLLTDPKANMSSEFGGVTSPIANVWLKDGDEFEIADLPISVVGTPGFTSGSLTYVLATDDAAIAFTGDFLYKDGISSATMPTSNEDELHQSLDHFLGTQFAETLVFPGHGENTSVPEFYRQMTGKTISVLADESSEGDTSPVIIVERDTATSVVTKTEQVYVPVIEYRTETIVVDRYTRPWVSFGVEIPLWSSWYRPWGVYYSYRSFPIPSIYMYRPSYWRPHHYYGAYYGGHYPQPLVVPPRPGRPMTPPGYMPPRRDTMRSGYPGIAADRRGNMAVPPGRSPEIRPPRPDSSLTNRPGRAMNRPARSASNGAVAQGSATQAQPLIAPATSSAATATNNPANTAGQTRQSGRFQQRTQPGGSSSGTVREGGSPRTQPNGGSSEVVRQGGPQQRSSGNAVSSTGPPQSSRGSAQPGRSSGTRSSNFPAGGARGGNSGSRDSGRGGRR